MTEPHDIWLRQGLAHHQKGELEQAERVYRRILERQPRHADALHLLGGIEGIRGNHDEALSLIDTAIEANARVALFHANRAALLLELRRAEEALAAADRALALDARLPEGHNHRGTALVFLDRADEAMAAYQQALALQPNYAEVHSNLGNLYRGRGDLNQAKQCYLTAIRLNPRDAGALNNLAAVYLGEQAVDEAELLLRKAIAVQPNATESLNNLGLVQQLQGKYQEATRSFAQALKTRPEHDLWQLRKEAVCPVIPPNRKAIGYWRKRFEKALGSIAPIDLGRYAAELTKSNAHPPYPLAYQGEDNCDLKRRYAELFHHREPENLVANRSGRTRIAFLVTRGHEGIFLSCTKGIIQRWGASDAVLTIVGPTSSLEKIRASLEPVPALQWLAIPEDLPAAVRIIRQAAFDLVYFWEVGSDSLNYFLPFFRLAPIQCTSWGTSETSGVPNIDAYLSSRLWESGGQAHYTEKLILLDHIPCAYEPPVLQPNQRKARTHYGLPADTPFYFCPQNLFKLHPDFDDLIARLLAEDRDARFVLVSGKRDHWTTLLRTRLEKRLGVDGDRLVFLPRLSYSDYLNLLCEADVLLDSLHFSGGNTSMEAVAMGVPVVTLPGRFIRGRFTLGCYRQMGFSETIAQDEDDWLRLALELAHDAEKRAELRATVAAKSVQLLRCTQAAQEFEATLVRLAREGAPDA